MQIGLVFGSTGSALYLPFFSPRLYYFASNRGGLNPQTRIESKPISCKRTAAGQLGEANGGKGRRYL